MIRSYNSSHPCASMACSGTALLFNHFKLNITTSDMANLFQGTDVPSTLMNCYYPAVVEFGNFVSAEPSCVSTQ
jgi:hypothetical protein